MTLTASLKTISLVFLCASLSVAPARGWDDAARVQYPTVQPRTLTFPRDHGAHPAYRTEWWYVTGWIEHDGIERGFQITFFRNRPGVQEDNPSAFAPKQLIFAHAAIADARHGRLLHDQRAARQGFGLAYARTGTTHVAIDDWTLIRDNDAYRAHIPAQDFVLDLRLVPTQPVLLNGHDGYSAKSPVPGEASYYYSLPQLQVDGWLRLDGSRVPVRGRAWLDHEWSSQYLPADAQGWDWASINFADGAVLMAFRMRRSDGGVGWAGGSLRDRSGALTILSADDVDFKPTRLWRSSRTGVEYPVAMRLRAGQRVLELEPLMDDQELDSRASTGIIYWEGAMRVRAGGEPVGQGYLELTGYGGRPEM